MFVQILFSEYRDLPVYTLLNFNMSDNGGDELDVQELPGNEYGKAPAEDIPATV